MINRYRRAARSLSEMGIGALSPLDEALPELGALVEPAPGNGSEVAAKWQREAEIGPQTANEKRREPEGSRRVAEERTRTFTGVTPLEPESGGVVANGGVGLENTEQFVAESARSAPFEPGAAISNASAAISTARAAAVAELGQHVGRLAVAGDFAGARVLERALRELLEEPARDPEGATS